MWFSIEGLPVVSVKNCKKLVGCSTNTKKAMLRIVDTSSRRGALPNVDSSRASLPKEGFLPVEGEAELLVQLIRDEQLELIDLQKATLYIYAITDRNRSSLGYFGAVEFLKTNEPS